MADLAHQELHKINKDTLPLNNDEITPLLALLTAWQYSDELKTIFKEFRFKNYYQTITFVNALAWIANQADHHPDLEVGYNRCLVKYTTHVIDGLSKNDFICAARIDQLNAE